ncbi:YdaE family protein [Salmonella enterica]|uniref:YdaE family protein n=1 Tax=Salmonella enterica TaxID=28901 RepID=UPI0020CA4BD3|nr:YdaE family protein [Salmonella enterica]
MMPVIASRSDWMRSPAKQQAAINRKPGLIRKIYTVLTQKGDPTLINCACCQKAIPEEAAYKYELKYIHGSLVSCTKQTYCSKRCARWHMNFN